MPKDPAPAESPPGTKAASPRRRRRPSLLAQISVILVALALCALAIVYVIDLIDPLPRQPGRPPGQFQFVAPIEPELVWSYKPDGMRREDEPTAAHLTCSVSFSR